MDRNGGKKGPKGRIGKPRKNGGRSRTIHARISWADIYFIDFVSKHCATSPAYQSRPFPHPYQQTCIHKEEVEVLEVELSYAVVGPGTMVVHAADTATTLPVRRTMR